MNISFGMITKEIQSAEPLDDFLDNAKRFGHEIYSVVIAHTGVANPDAVRELEKRVPVQLVQINQADEMCSTLEEIGMSKQSIETLVTCKHLNDSGLVGYGKNRNNVVMKAMLTGSDILIFVDTDVYPKLLVDTINGVVKHEIDFVGEHMKYLSMDSVMITTSDYSGYYIIPPMKFSGMEMLYRGLQKEGVCDFLQAGMRHHCFVPANYPDRKPFQTNKILGGNVAIKLSIFEHMLPFFSSVYSFDGKKYLTRGEDTLLGLELERSDTLKCMDIDLRIFHNTYGSYPQVPDILTDDGIRDRFFYACMGWIGRNPFLNWLMKKDVEGIYKAQRQALEIGAQAAAAHLGDERFLELPRALDASYAHLDDMIMEYKKMAKSWTEFISKYKVWRDDYESAHYESLSVGRVRQRHLHDESSEGAECFRA